MIYLSSRDFFFDCVKFTG